MSEERVEVQRKGDGFGPVLGIIVFLAGVALLAFTFKLAYDMFTVPPAQALAIEPGKAIDVGVAGQNFATLLVRVLLLIVMAIVGSLVANRGIKMYADSRR